MYICTCTDMCECMYVFISMYAFTNVCTYSIRSRTSSSCGRVQVRSVGVRACTAKTFAPEFSSSSAHCKVFLISTFPLQLSSAYWNNIHRSTYKEYAYIQSHRQPCMLMNRVTSKYTINPMEMQFQLPLRSKILGVRTCIYVCIYVCMYVVFNLPRRL